MLDKYFNEKESSHGRVEIRFSFKNILSFYLFTWLGFS